MDQERMLTDDEVLLVKRTVLTREYKSETEGYKGKKYRIYAFGKNAFTVHEDEPFHEDFANGNVKDIQIVVTDEGWSLANYIPWDKAIANRRRKVAYEGITAESVKVKEPVRDLG